MRRSKRRDSRDEESGSSPLAPSTVPYHYTSVTGLSNTTRSFLFDDPSNGPQVVFRYHLPFAALYHGFTASDISAQDWTAATDTAADLAAPLLPVTPYSHYWTQDVFQHVENMVNIGVGARTQLNYNAAVRYLAMVARSIVDLQSIINLYSLAYNYDWTKVAPFGNPVTPPYLKDIAEKFDATPTGMTGRWLPLMKQFDHMIVWPNLATGIKRNMTPFMAVDMGGRLQVPITMDAMSPEFDADVIEQEVRDRLDYLNSAVSALTETKGLAMYHINALLSSFMPYPIRDQALWAVHSAPATDILRDSGWFNSGTSMSNIFGDTGDPLAAAEQVFFVKNPPDTRSADSWLFYSRDEAARWMEVRESCIYVLNDNGLLDNTYALVSPHWYGKCWIVDDKGEFAYLDDTAIGEGDPLFRYRKFFNNRFTMGSLPYGTNDPGYMGADINYENTLRLLRLDVGYDWSLEVLKDINARMIGASLREIRVAFETLVVEGSTRGM